MFDTFFNKVA